MPAKRWTPRCGNRRCQGWVHNAGPTGRSIQTCDDCGRYAYDDSARRAHQKFCLDPLCEFGRTQAGANLKSIIDEVAEIRAGIRGKLYT